MSESLSFTLRKAADALQAKLPKEEWQRQPLFLIKDDGDFREYMGLNEKDRAKVAMILADLTPGQLDEVRNALGG